MRAGGSTGRTARSDHPDLLVVDMAEEDFDRRLWNVVPYQGHLSPYGNEVVARTLTRALGAGAGEWARPEAPM